MATIKHPLPLPHAIKRRLWEGRRANKRVTQVTLVGRPFAPELQIGLSAGREAALFPQRVPDVMRYPSEYLDCVA